MAYYKLATGDVSEIANPDLNPNLTQGATLLSGSNYNDALKNAGTISGAILSSQPVENFQTPENILNYPIQGLVPVGSEEKKANEISSIIQELNTASIGEGDYQAQQNEAQGVNKYAKEQRDLGIQIQNLVNQSLDLDNQYNYTVPNKMQEGAMGRGVTAGGLAPIQASELRKIQIQKGAIASQALTLKSAFEATQGNLATAQSLADQAVIQKFGRAKEKLKALTANLDVILKSPAYTREEKARAAKEKEVQDRNAADIKRQEESFKTGQAMATAAIVNNPGNQVASFAAQQLLKLDPSDPNYLQKAFELVGKFQTDPVAIKTAMLQQQKAELDLAIANEERPYQKQELQKKLDLLDTQIAKNKTTTKLTDENRRTLLGVNLTDEFISNIEEGVQTIGIEKVLEDDYTDEQKKAIREVYGKKVKEVNKKQITVAAQAMKEADVKNFFTARFTEDEISAFAKEAGFAGFFKKRATERADYFASPKAREKLAELLEEQYKQQGYTIK